VTTRYIAIGGNYPTESKKYKLRHWMKHQLYDEVIGSESWALMPARAGRLRLHCRWTSTYLFKVKIFSKN